MIINFINQFIYKHRERQQEKAASVFLVVCYATWCVREFKWTGKFVYNKLIQRKVPEVFYFDDHNGVRNEWRKISITNTTTGWIDSVTFDYTKAVARVNFLTANQHYGAYNDNIS